MDSKTKAVRNKYSDIAKSIASKDDSADDCLKATGVCNVCDGGSVVAGEAENLYDSQAIARLSSNAKLASRGCGDPVAVAGISPGDTVVDLGSGGGIDAILASAYVGLGGKVFGVDMTPEMIELARENAQASECANVEFINAQIDDIPLPSSIADVVISNCVINLVVDKAAAFKEALRILKPGGEFVFSDILAFKPIMPWAGEHLKRLTGCINGISSKDAYFDALRNIGFTDVVITQKTLYTWDVYESRLPARGKSDILEAARGVGGIDGTCASAIIRARKPQN